MIHNDDLVQILRKLSIDLKFAADRVAYFNGFVADRRWEMLMVSKKIVESLVRDAGSYEFENEKED